MRLAAFVLALVGCQSTPTRPADVAEVQQLVLTASVAAAERAPPPAAAAAATRSGPVKVELVVKEVAGTGAEAYPVSAVVPLPQGRFKDTSGLMVVDARGQPMPAQLEVLNRHWAKDDSIRHVMLHFQSTLTSRGEVRVTLVEGTARPAPDKPVIVAESEGAISISTGVMDLRIARKPFAIETPTGPLVAELVTADGKRERSFEGADDLTIEVEESGPMRAVIRVESPAKMIGKGRVRHGAAMRLYAYAGKPFLAVDYQLQNSPKNDLFGAPLYFDALSLRVPASRDGKGKVGPKSVRADALEVDPVDKAPPMLSAPEVQVTIRRFWETWPNGLSIDARGMVSAELFPSWGARRFQGKPSRLGLHWLDDMQHVVKQALFRFGPPDPQLDALAATFSLHPVAIVPVSWYADTEVTLDMGGVFPRRAKVGDSDHRKPLYATYRHGNQPLPLRFGWDNFGVDLYRKHAPNTAGDWPYSSARCFLTEDPADHWAAEDFAMGDLNVRPEWMARYDHARDFEALKLSENPYGGWSWRHFDGKHGYNPSALYRKGSGQETKPRDDQHGWFYHIEEAYYCTGNPWIRDYYRFIAQFRRTRLHQKDPYPDMLSRAVGHSLSHALQAYRVTGDEELLALVGKYLVEHLAPRIDPATGGYLKESEAMFQFGYLAHAMVTYLEELPERDPKVLELLGGLVRWNMSYGNWGYYTDPKTPSPKSDLSSMTFADPQSWYGLLVNDQAVLANVDRYVRHGINGGDKPPIDLTDWTGDFNGRITAAALQLVKRE